MKIHRGKALAEPTEKQIENSILEYLWLRKIWCFKYNNGGIYDPNRKLFRKSYSPYIIKGIPDILGIYKRRFLAIEVKKPKSYPTKEQKAFIKAVNENGGIGFVARSIEDVEVNLKGK